MNQEDGMNCQNCCFCNHLDDEALALLNQAAIETEIEEELEDLGPPEEFEGTQEEYEAEVRQIIEDVSVDRDPEAEIVGVCQWMPVHVPVTREHFCAQFVEVKRVHQ